MDAVEEQDQKGTNHDMSVINSQMLFYRAAFGGGGVKVYLGELPPYYIEPTSIISWTTIVNFLFAIFNGFVKIIPFNAHQNSYDCH